MSDPRLILTCGLPGAGKTTLAMRLAAERNAVRLTKDEWLWSIGASPWDRSTGERMERELWRLAQEIVSRGVSVVVDFGLWARAERDEMRTVARALDVGVELHHVDAPPEELWRRVEFRNSASPWSAAPIRRSDLEAWAATFEAPDRGELALFDPAPEMWVAGHDGSVEEMIEAGFGLDYHDLRLDRTTERWVGVGAALRDHVGSILGADVADVQQIGSSSVVGLLAKPIIDLAAGIAGHHDIVRIQAKLEKVGWIYRGDAGDDGGHVFVLEARPRHRIAHLHVVDAHGGQWHDYLRLRELLRRNSDARRAYEAVKLQLIDDFGNDRKAYTNGKSTIVRSLLEEFEQAVTRMGPVTLSDDVVVLRPWVPADASFLATASRDPAIQRYNGAPPDSLADATSVIERIELGWRSFSTHGDSNGVAFAIVDAASGEPVGMCGLDDWSSTDVAQFGYWLAEDARGRGLATRAVTLMTTWLFGLGAARVFLTIQSGNAASAAVARRAGFTYEGTLRSYGVWQGRRQDVDVFAVLPDEWTEGNSP